MDLPPILRGMPAIAWCLIPILIILLILKILRSPWGKGFTGEILVRFLTWVMLSKTTYHRVHNVMLPTPDGTTQIDHVFISRFGIFVLETKNMSGWIFGGEYQASWTQKIFKLSFKFQNPLRQNHKHVKAIEAALEIPFETIHSVVTFIGESTFKTEMPRNVTSGAGFISYIKSFREPVFTEQQVVELLQRIESVRLPSTFALRRKHVQNLKDRSNPDAERSCPRCGSPLVLRTVKSGKKAGRQFWGCSTFPKCRTMQDMA